MNVQKRNDVTIYNLSSGPMLPEWLADRARRNLSKRDEGIRRRIELIQDFQMPSNSSRVVQSSGGDSRYIVVGGAYPPRIRCYDTHDLTMKFERYVDAQVVDIVMLGDDYGKIAILQDDRTVSFHAHYGKHESIRIPKFGRGMAYESTTCELLIAGSNSSIYRLSLEVGQFSEPWSIDGKNSENDVNCSSITVSQSHPLASVGGTDGVVRFFDNRASSSVTPILKLDVKAGVGGLGFFDHKNSSSVNYISPYEITSIAYDPTGLYMAAGSAGGLVSLYDVRSSKPLHIKEHKHGLPVHTLKFHTGSGCVFSSDEKLIKIWKYKSCEDSLVSDRVIIEKISGSNDNDGSRLGAVVANVESAGKFSNFITGGDKKDPTGSRSGLILCATDQPKLEAYYIPKIGLAPTWCSFLENITEEMEERDLKREDGPSRSSSEDVLVRDGQERVFDNYKFVNREVLEKLGVSHLIGTQFLKAYMHGFFMDNNLYNKIRSVSDPFEYEEYRKKKIKERLEAKRASRIAPKLSKNNQLSSAAAVNPDLAERLQNKAVSNTKSGQVAKIILSDDRFGGLFTNEDYEIDEEDENFKMRNPSGVAAVAIKRKRNDDVDSDEEYENNNQIDRVEYEQKVLHNASDFDDDDYDSDSDSDDDGFRGGQIRGENYDQIKGRKKSQKETSTHKRQQNGTVKSMIKAVMYESNDTGFADNVGIHAGLEEAKALAKMKAKIRNMNLPLEKRFRMEKNEHPVVKVIEKCGSKEISYIPKDTKSKNNDNGRNSKRNRRGINDLKF